MCKRKTEKKKEKSRPTNPTLFCSFFVCGGTTTATQQQCFYFRLGGKVNPFGYGGYSGGDFFPSRECRPHVTKKSEKFSDFFFLGRNTWEISVTALFFWNSFFLRLPSSSRNSSPEGTRRRAECGFREIFACEIYRNFSLQTSFSPSLLLEVLELKTFVSKTPRIAFSSP